jgi:hypothetical protein
VALANTTTCLRSVLAKIAVVSRHYLAHTSERSEGPTNGGEDNGSDSGRIRAATTVQRSICTALEVCVRRLQCFDSGGEDGKQESVPRVLVTAFQVGLKEREREFTVLRVPVYCFRNMIHMHGRHSQKEYLGFSRIYSKRAFAIFLSSWTMFRTFNSTLPHMPCKYTHNSATKPDPHDRPIKLWVPRMAWACGSLKLTWKSVKFDLSACGDF